MSVSPERKAYLKQYFSDPANAERRRAASRRWKAKNREHLRAYHRQYYPAWWAANGARVAPAKAAYKRRLRALHARARRIHESERIRWSWFDQGRERLHTAGRGET